MVCKMTREELRDTLERLDISQGAFAARVSDLSGLNVLPSHISKMCSRAATGRNPSPVVAVAARLMLEKQDADRLRQAVEQAGWKQER